MTDVAAASGGTLSIEHVIRETFGICRRNLVTLLLLAAIFYGAVIAIAIVGVVIGGVAIFAGGGGIGNMMAAAPFIVLLAVFVIAASVALQAASIQVAVADLSRRRTSVGPALQLALSHVWPLVGIGLLAGLGIGFGFMLFVVPGLILMTIWSVVVPVRIVENTGVFDSFGRSAQLTKGSRWSIFGLVVLYMFVTIMFQWALNGALGQFVGFIGSILLSIPAPVGIAVIYMELRRIKGEATPESLASVFD